jgi:hypothetical protein
MFFIQCKFKEFQRTYVHLYAASYRSVLLGKVLILYDTFNENELHNIWDC